MAARKKNKKMFVTKRRLVIFVLLICATLLAGFFLLYTQRASDDNSGSARTTSNEPSAQADFSDGGSEKVDNTSNNEDRNQGSAEIRDRNGTPSTSTGAEVVSSDGNITVYLPVKDTVVKVGQEVSGKTALSSVHYRIIDSVSGVIATGQLTVVDGQFSGELSFNTSASEGRLDIYAVKSDGTEVSNVEVPLRFK